MLVMLCLIGSRAGQWQALAASPIAVASRAARNAPRDSLDFVRFRLPLAGRCCRPGLWLQLHHRERLETLFARAAERTIVVNGAATWRVPPEP